MQTRIWIKAFIPASVYNLQGQEITFRLRDKDDQNISVIPLQSYFPSLTPLYETDNRTFSDSPSLEDSARITTVIEIPSDKKNEIGFKCYSNPTRQIMKSIYALFSYSDPMNVAQIGLDHSATEHPVCEHTNISRSKNKINLSFTITGSNPFFYIGRINLAPPIKMKFNLNIQKKVNGDMDIYLRGKTTQFPAFEAYAQIDDNVVPLFRREPEKGKTPFHLIYGTTEKVEVKISIASHTNRLFSLRTIPAIKDIQREVDKCDEPFNPPLCRI